MSEAPINPSALSAEGVPHPLFQSALRDAEDGAPTPSMERSRSHTQTLTRVRNARINRHTQPELTTAMEGLLRTLADVDLNRAVVREVLPRVRWLAIDLLQEDVDDAAATALTQIALGLTRAEVLAGGAAWFARDRGVGTIVVNVDSPEWREAERAKQGNYIGPRTPTRQASMWTSPIPMDGTEGSLRKYLTWLLNEPIVLSKVPELRGKVLGCTCAPGVPCHGRVLAVLANNGSADTP